MRLHLKHWVLHSFAVMMLSHKSVISDIPEAVVLSVLQDQSLALQHYNLVTRMLANNWLWLVQVDVDMVMRLFDGGYGSTPQRLPVWGALVWGISRCRTAPVWAQGSAAAAAPSVHSVSHISPAPAPADPDPDPTRSCGNTTHQTPGSQQSRDAQRNSPLLQRRPVPEELAVLLLLSGRVLVNQLVCFLVVFPREFL